MSLSIPSRPESGKQFEYIAAVALPISTPAYYSGMRDRRNQPGISGRRGSIIGFRLGLRCRGDPRASGRLPPAGADVPDRMATSRIRRAGCKSRFPDHVDVRVRAHPWMSHSVGFLLPGAVPSIQSLLRNRLVRWIALGIAALLVVGVVLWGRKGRHASGLVPRALVAYVQGDWEVTASLARQRLKEAPNDEEALRLAARATARKDRDQAAISTYSRVELR